MKKEIETNEENYSKELQKQIKINKNEINKILENTEEALIVISENECFTLGRKINLIALFSALVGNIYINKIMTENELIHAVKCGIETASFEREKKKDKEFEKDLKDLLNSIKKFMED